MSEGSMEFRLINPSETGFLKHIEWNSEEIKDRVREMMESYKGVVYTEDTMKAAKDDRATLNKLKKAIEDRRKEVKRRCMEPYEQFEKEVKDILALIEEPASLIDGQIKEYEERKKEEKRNALEAAYKDAIGDLAGILPFEKVFEARYLNQTVSLAKAYSEIKAKIDKVRTDIDTIDGMDSKYKLNVKDVYVKTLDLSMAMAEDRRLRNLEERLEAQRREKEEAERRRLAEIEAMKKREEEERLAREKAAEEMRRAEAERIAQKAQEEARAGSGISPTCCQPGRSADAWKEDERKEDQDRIQEPEKPNDPDHPNFQNMPFADSAQAILAQQPVEKKYKAKFYCIGTLEQIRNLGNYMRENGIEFGKVEK